MIDAIREFFPVQSIGPLLGGAVVWFGANALYLGPEVLAPRIAERHFIPACLANLQTMSLRIEADEKSLLSAAEEKIEALRREMPGQVQRGSQALLQSFFGIYGEQGQEFMDYYGDQLGGALAGTTVPFMGQALEQRAAEYRQQALSEIESLRRTLNAGVQHASAASYCGCLVSETFENRLDLAAYTSSFRLYAPPVIEQRRQGAIPPTSAACGTPPLLAQG
jgi:hypothetical protein